MNLDLTNKKFNRLTAIKIIGKTKEQGNLWECLCDCGGKAVVPASRIKNGYTKSCGCINREQAQTLRPIVHGEAIGGKPTPEYKAWSHIKGRCHNETEKRYEDYGGRGIIVCDRWRYSFDNFLKDMGRRPSPEHSIDRWPNNDGNYEPGNCRWATVPEQSRGRRSNRWFEHNGEKMVLKDWAASLNIHQDTIRRSIKRGLTFEQVYKLYENRRINATNTSQ